MTQDEQARLLDAFELPPYSQVGPWRFDFDFPGNFAYTHDGKGWTVFFTPDWERDGHVAIQTVTEEGVILLTEEAPFTSMLPEDLFAIVKPYIKGHTRKDWDPRESLSGAQMSGSQAPPPWLAEILDYANQKGLDLGVDYRTVDPREIQVEEMVDTKRVKSIIKALRKSPEGWPETMPVPVVVEGETLLLLDGSHRTVAALHEGLTSIPVLMVNSSAYWGLKDEFDISGFDYIHELLPLVDLRAAENVALDTGANDPRTRSLEAWEISPGSLGASGTRSGHREALVVVHLSSLDAFTALAGSRRGAELGENLSHAIQTHDGPVIIVDQGWELGRRESRPRKDLLEAIAPRRDLIWVQFDEASQPWDPFLKELREKLEGLGVEQVLVGGIWYNPTQWSGCATHVAKHLGKSFNVHVDQALVGCESEAGL